MAQAHSNSVDRSLAQLPEHQRAAAAEQAWTLFQSDDKLSWAEATAFVVAATLAQPAPMGQRIAKARQVVIVESASTPGRVYEVVNGVCNCPAASFGRTCWHLRAARQQDRQAA